MPSPSIQRDICSEMNAPMPQISAERANAPMFPPTTTYPPSPIVRRSGTTARFVTMKEEMRFYVENYLRLFRRQEGRQAQRVVALGVSRADGQLPR